MMIETQEEKNKREVKSCCSRNLQKKIEDMSMEKEPILYVEDWGVYLQEPGKQTLGNISAKDLAWFNAFYVGNDIEKNIFLTVDCGYENGNTSLILDILKKHNVKATFL